MSTLPPLFNIERILSCLADNTLVLTPNNRLRNKVIDAWGLHQQAQDCDSWAAPNVFSFEQWVNDQWLLLQSFAYSGTDAIVINHEQQRLLWEQITKDCHLLQSEQVAADALSAFRLLEQWNLLTNNDILKQLSPQFLNWIKRYQQQLQAQGMLTPEARYPVLRSALNDNVLLQKDTIYLLGFDDLSPAIEELLKLAGKSITPISAKALTPKSLQRVQCDSNNDEIQAAAQWAHQILEENSQARIGIIVPSLMSSRDKVQELLAAELEPQYYDNSIQAYTLPFNISAGTPLANTPLIASTLKLLHLQEYEWDTEFICQCLSSPFWGKYSEELSLRIELIHKLRALNLFTISGNILRELSQKLAKDSEGSNNQTLFNYFYSLSEYNPNQRFNFSDKQLPSQWVTHFLALLDILQWPGERKPNSQEYQQTQLWYQLLENFAHLDQLLGKINAKNALKELHTLASHLPFQEKVIDSPIQVLGILEGTGLQFTHCWIMGMDQQAWPPAAKPNPFLPVYIQREYGMPHSSSLRELHYAESLTNQYKHCAENIIFSSANYNPETEQRLQASTLIQELPLIALKTIITTQKNNTLYQWQENLQKSRQPEITNCFQAPPFTDTHLKGGSHVLKAQANNPFDAFIQYRLHAAPYDQPVNGFSPLDKGNILHQSLAGIWQVLKTQQALIDIESKKLDKLITKQVKQSIESIQKKRKQKFSGTLCNIETDRQVHIIQQWLEKEKQRPTFTVIAIEEAQQITFNGISIDIRIDRVDQLSDGSFLIIDYKTGKTTAAVWSGERISDPQLPLYAISYHHTVSGISFATINIEEQQFNGLSNIDNKQSGISDSETNRYFYRSWEETLANWRVSLTQLLEEFQQGICHIDYSNGIPPQYAQDYLKINRYYESNDIRQFINNRHLKGKPSA